uniref:Cystathionine gamma-synthase n=2 Tax=Brassica oleracea var. oleracea TaxID=109376 RepID=A0A0D3EFB9_BRAOL
MASGMCASTVVLLAMVPRGGHIVTTTDCYKETRMFIETFLPKLGITPTLIDASDIAGLQAIVNNHEVSMFFTESPTNPFLRCVDIKLVSEICHKRGTLVCIDGTIATPLNQKALALGADLVIQSATKYIGGHNDVLAGCISGSMKLVSEIRIMHNLLGGTLSPKAAYLLIWGIKTMHLRVKQQNSTTLRMARVLEAHPKVFYTPSVSLSAISGRKLMLPLLLPRATTGRVYYPGLPSHPEHHIAKRKMTYFGGLVTFETTIKFIDSLKIPYIATSFGGCESFVDQPAARNWDVPRDERLKYGLKDNLVRFSFGVEDFDDLKADILQALDTIPTKTSLYSHQNGVVSDKN